MIETLLTARLKTLTPNVYPNFAPTNYKTPCIVYQRLDTEAMNDFDNGVQDEGFVTFQFAISSTVFGEAKMMARNVRNSLRDWKEPEVQAVSWIDEHVMGDDSTETVLHRVLVFFKFHTTAL